VVTVVARQHLSAGFDEERDVSINDIVGATLPEELADLLGGRIVEGDHAHTGKHPCEVRLSCTVAPHLGERPCTRSDRHAVSLEDSQHGADSTVALVDRHEGTGIECGAHAAPRRRPAAPSAATAALSSSSLKGPSTVTKAYRLLRAVLATAVADELIAKNPCALRGAGVERPSERPVIAVETVLAIATAIEPRFRALVLLAAFGGLRLGELQGLRRRHLHLSTGTVRIIEQAQMLKDGSIVTGPPKSDAGVRTVTMPAVLVPALETHVMEWAAPGRDGLLFCGSSGQHFRRASFYTAWRRACAAAGVTDLHPHDLRHTGNTLAAALGASTKELMKRFGHSSARAALIYQHASRERDEAIAKGLDELIRGSLDPENAPDVARMWHADLPEPSEDPNADTGNVA